MAPCRAKATTGQHAAIARKPRSSFPGRTSKRSHARRHQARPWRRATSRSQKSAPGTVPRGTMPPTLGSCTQDTNPTRAAEPRRASPVVIRDHRGAALTAHVLAHAREFFGVFLFRRNYRFEQLARRAVLLAQIADAFAIGVDRNALGDQVLREHIRQQLVLRILAGAAIRGAQRIEIRLASEFHDTCGNLVRVALLILGALL